MISLMNQTNLNCSQFELEYSLKRKRKMYNSVYLHEYALNKSILFLNGMMQMINIAFVINELNKNPFSDIKWNHASLKIVFNYPLKHTNEVFFSKAKVWKINMGANWSFYPKIIIKTNLKNFNFKNIKPDDFSETLV